MLHIAGIFGSCLIHTCICKHYTLWNVHNSFFWIDTVSIYDIHVCIYLNLLYSKLNEMCLFVEVQEGLLEI